MASAPDRWSIEQICSVKWFCMSSSSVSRLNTIGSPTPFRPVCNLSTDEDEERMCSTSEISDECRTKPPTVCKLSWHWCVWCSIFLMCRCQSNLKNTWSAVKIMFFVVFLLLNSLVSLSQYDNHCLGVAGGSTSRLPHGFAFRISYFSNRPNM